LPPLQASAARPAARRTAVVVRAQAAPAESRRAVLGGLFGAPQAQAPLDNSSTRHSARRLPLLRANARRARQAARPPARRGRPGRQRAASRRDRSQNATRALRNLAPNCIALVLTPLAPGAALLVGAGAARADADSEAAAMKAAVAAERSAAAELIAKEAAKLAAENAVKAKEKSDLAALRKKENAEADGA
jgi:hypothetical protein